LSLLDKRSADAEMDIPIEKNAISNRQNRAWCGARAQTTAH
jgi:hypothetical protein